MTGPPVRVAVQLGTAFVRVAGAAAEGAPWLVAELPAPAREPAQLLAELVGGPPDELVLVHPGHWSATRATAWAAECAGLARRVRAVPAPLAAAGCGDVVVLDIGAAATAIDLLDPDGRVRASATADVGGTALDELLAARCGRDPDAMRAVRERLALLPAAGGFAAVDLLPVLARPLGTAVTVLRAVLAMAVAQRRVPPPVLLVGGVARCPLLARELDEAGIADVTVAPRPEAAAVLGALALGSDVGVVASPPAEQDGGDGAPPPLPSRWLPVLPPRHRAPLRTVVRTVAGVVAVAALLAVGLVASPPRPAREPVPAGVLVQYGYRFDVPPGWAHTGGRPDRRRVLLGPVVTPRGSDLIVVESAPLGYDTAAEPQRARVELRAVFDESVAAGGALVDYDPHARFAGRAVTAYQELDSDSGGPAGTRWFVVLDGPTQLSVGCRHTAAGAAAVRAACAVVVGSVRRT